MDIGNYLGGMSTQNPPKPLCDINDTHSLLKALPRDPSWVTRSIIV